MLALLSLQNHMTFCGAQEEIFTFVVWKRVALNLWVRMMAEFSIWGGIKLVSRPAKKDETHWMMIVILKICHFD